MTNNIDIKSLARQLASAKNYLFEATMNEYRIESIRRGEDNLATIKKTITDFGLNPDDIIEYNETRGCWEPTDSPRLTEEGKRDLAYEEYYNC